jgi:hypothetical protein
MEIERLLLIAGILGVIRQYDLLRKELWCGVFSFTCLSSWSKFPLAFLRMFKQTFVSQEQHIRYVLKIPHENVFIKFELVE